MSSEAPCEVRAIPRASTHTCRRGPRRYSPSMQDTHDSPVQVDVTSPQRFDRLQLLVRILLSIVLGWFGITSGWLISVLFVGLPVVAAIAISTRGGAGYLAQTGPAVWRVLVWLLQFSAYMALLVDRFPSRDDPAVRPTIRYDGAPSVGGALVRLLTSIPSGLVLCVLGFVGSVLWLIAAITVLVAATVPAPLLAYQRGVLRWQARLVAYHASLVADYPPFALDTGDGAALPRATVVAP